MDMPSLSRLSSKRINKCSAVPWVALRLVSPSFTIAAEVSIRLMRGVHSEQGSAGAVAFEKDPKTARSIDSDGAAAGARPRGHLERPRQEGGSGELASSAHSNALGLMLSMCRSMQRVARLFDIWDDLPTEGDRVLDMERMSALSRLLEAARWFRNDFDASNAWMDRDVSTNDLRGKRPANPRQDSVVGTSATCPNRRMTPLAQPVLKRRSNVPTADASCLPCINRDSVLQKSENACRRDAESYADLYSRHATHRP